VQARLRIRLILKSAERVETDSRHQIALPAARSEPWNTIEAFAHASRSAGHVLGPANRT
jgi:hypothetical protein